MDLTKVDVAWVLEQLAHYVTQTRAVTASSGVVMTARMTPACGRPEAISLTETIRPILDRLYPEWRSENPTSRNDEFKAERDASQRLTARIENHEEVARRLGGTDTSPQLATGSMHPLIWSSARSRGLRPRTGDREGPLRFRLPQPH